jgi:acyl dehydratase
MHLDRVGAESAPIRFSWRPPDCSLYALAAGAGVDDVAFTTEGNTGVPQRVLPTFAFAAVAAAAADWPDPCFGTGDFPLERALLGEQLLTVHEPLGAAGAVDIRVRVAGIHDKGSGALVVLEQVATDVGSSRPVFTSTVGLFVRGEGGFGGEPSPPSAFVALPDRSPDHRVVTALPSMQTALYRHAGNDTNPVHVDPEFARRAGFDGPILTGQNSLGIACRALVASVCDDDPTRLERIGGRFVAPAYNGDRLTTELWLADDPDDARVVRFRVTGRDDGTVVDRGVAHLR